MFDTVLVIVDDAALGQASRPAGVVDWVRRLVRRSGAEVRLLAVCPPGAAVTVAGRTIAFAHQVEGARRDEALAGLRAVAARLLAEGIPAAVDVSFEPWPRAVVETARRTGAGLVALTLDSRGPSRTDRAALAALERLRVPVLVSCRGRQRAA